MLTPFDVDILGMIGLDITDVSRFKKLKRTAAILQKTFTRQELDYCFGFSDAAPHLAGLFAAKEAVAKAILGKVVVYEIEIRHAANGQPLVWRKNKQDKKITVSITHTDTIAAAVALQV